jgi:diguanylate cyclase (GGDEF)-like protein/PAS domain S-box-containing protein
MSIAMRALPDAPALLVDRAGLVVRANAQAGDLAGVADPDELIGLSLDTLLEKTGPDGERRLCRPADPDDQPVVVRAVHWRVPGTGLDAVLLTDISDLVATSEALRIERRRLDEAAAFANLGWWEFDPAAEAIVLSPSLRMLLGVGPDAERIAVSDALDLLHPDDVEPARESWDRYRRSGRPIDLEYRIANPAGGYRWMHALSSAGRPDDRGERTPSGCVMDITERRRDRDALAAERAALLDAQRIARMGSFSYDVRTTQFSRSEVLQEMYDEVGVDPGNDLLANIDSEFRPQAEELQRRLIDATIRDPVEMEVRGEVGGRVYLGRARAKHGSNHEIVAIEGTVQDVTERRQLEERLRAENERFSVAQRTARMGVWQWNTRTGECVWSTMMYELLGIPDHEPADCQRFLDLVHPDDLGWLEEAVRQLVEDRQETECEIRMTRADGEVRTFRCYTAATQLSFEGDLLVVGVAQDITEQRMAENGMRRSSQRFADLVTVAPVGIALFDSDNRLLDLNDALCDLLGYNVEDVRGRDVLMFIHPDEVPAHKRVRKAIAQSDRMNYRVPQRILLRADGEPLYCELHLRRSVQDDGRLFWLVVVQDITERRRAAELLRHQATHDDLTGLPNRSAVNEVLGQLLAGPDAAKVAVLFCDIDNFKRVNDSLGHDAGDELLVSLARRLEDGLPEGCLVGRLSGDEYVVICSDVEAVGGVSTLTSRVSALLRTAVPVHGQLVRVSASIGATMPNGSPVTGGDLLRFADAAMFEAKDRGPGRVSVASPALIASADRQMRLEGELRDALASDGLTVYFQPVVGADGSVQTAEALVRWPHPSRGMLPPDVFLPVAEQGDLLRELDRWVLRTALIEATRWPMVDGRQIGVAVNLSGLVPGDPDFVDVVANTVAEVGIAWDRVVLELVETSLVDLPSRSRAAMRELVDRGVRFAVDDFGTGYSSLSRLKDLPAQIIKVDRSFVAGVSSDPSDFAVANAVVDMARAMGRSCVAEGVETATQFHVLRGMGVDAYQGWLFSPAVPPKEFRKLLDFGSLDVPNPS